MTAATERETQQFLQEYGIRSINGIPCFQEKLRACLIVFEKTGELPRIYQKNIPGGNHSYLVFDGLVYNQFDAESADATPDCSLEELKQDAVDFTAFLFLGAYMVSIGNYEDDVFGIQSLEDTLVHDLTEYESAMKHLEAIGEKRVDLHTYYQHVLMMAITEIEDAGGL